MAKSNLTKKLVILAIVVLLLGLLITFVALRILSNKVTYTPRDAYDKTGFVKVTEFDEDEVFVLKNDRFEFKLFANTTKFQLFDDKTKQTWYSNPEEVGSNYPIEFHDLYNVYYEMLLETPKVISVKEKSIDLNNYLFKVTDDAIEVLYEVGRDQKITFYDLPYQVTSEHYNELIIEPLRQKVREGVVASRHLTVLINAFMYVPQSDSYLLLQNKFNTQDSIDLAYELIFTHSDYTMAAMEEDRDRFSFPNAAEKPYFEFVVRYELSEKGFNLRIINDSIFETEAFPMAYIDVLPYFGANNLHDEGITVIPDGSGVLLDHNDGNYASGTYEKRIYGRDLAIGSDTNIRPEANDIIKMPMYGYTKNDNGFISIVEESDTMAGIRAGYRTTGTDTYTNKVPWIHYRYHIRERDGFTFQSWASQQRVSIWTKQYNTEDFASSYIFTDDTYTEVGYYELAKVYQDYLVDKYNLVAKTYDDLLHITVLGGYIYKKHFLGIPYDSIQSLTTSKQILEIINLIDSGDNQLDISYQGWSNKGLKPTVMDKIKFNKNITTKKQLVKLQDELESLGNRLFLEFFTQTAYTDKGLKNKDIARNIMQKDVKYYDYNAAMQIPYRNRLPQYTLSVQKQNAIYNTINNTNYVDGVVLTDEAQFITANFANRSFMFRKEAVDNTINNLENINKTVAVRNPNIFGALYTDKIIDLPINGGASRIADYGIPFVQLVYNGYLDYTMQSANLDTSKSINYYVLKAIESGSKMQFTLSYKNTVDLIKTQYSHYFSTFYNNWIDDINYVIDQLEGLGIYSSTIVSHKTLNSQGTMVEVVYSNGMKYTINYENETFVESSVM